MNFNFFRRKKSLQNQPEFWQEYSEKFESKIPKDIDEIRFVIFDTETTGFDFEKDRILSIGAVSVQNREISMIENFEVYLQQERFNPDTVKIHGIIQNDKFEKTTEFEALKLFLKYIENAVLVAHHAGFDLKMVNRALKRHELPKLKNKFLDTAYLYKKTKITTNLIDPERSYSLDEIAEDYNIEVIDRHTATGDAFITALIFMKLLGKIKKKGKLPLRTY